MSKYDSLHQTTFAHSANRHNKKHPLKEHLDSVADLAAIFARNADWGDEAEFTGKIHDIGKCSELFQARLRGEASGLDHWSPGAWLALKDFHAVAAAIAIQGHHIGLQKGDINSLRGMDISSLVNNHPLRLKLTAQDIIKVRDCAKKEGIEFQQPTNCIIDPQKGLEHPVAAMLDVRLLFSCLVDADFIDTEAHFEGDENGKCFRKPGPHLDPDKALRKLNVFMAEKVRQNNSADPQMIETRNALWEMASRAAAYKPGIFTLTAPTGSGKTLSMLKFGLEHAARNNLNRIIVAVPYLSIIEQTASVYRTVFEGFPENFILEHHSLAGLSAEDAAGDFKSSADHSRRLLAENWDAPIIITTDVQLLESMFSNRPVACRKLHNIMESVIMFDEVQNLPLNLAVPTLAALSYLSAKYRTTILFATATQPAFDAFDNAVTKHVPSGWRPTEVVPENRDLYEKLKRVSVEWPGPGELMSWAALADEIRAQKQCLCVVNLKKHATSLLEMLSGDDGIFHLSTNLCPLHRRHVLERVRRGLVEKKTCRLISTQCIEAGVDVDFPVVYRALAPLDAIAQAAGRCNREGKLVDPAGNKINGRVRIFEPETSDGSKSSYPSHAYFQAAEVTRSMLVETDGSGLDINDPTVFNEYYRRLYDISKPEGQNAELDASILSVDFVSTARQYRLISHATIQVLVPYKRFIALFNELSEEQDKAGINAKWIKRARGLAVNIFRPRYDHPAWEALIPAKLRFGKGKDVSDEWYILQEADERLYDDLLGLRLPASQQILIG